MIFDVAIVGGGPAGLAVALEAARRGLSTAVFERRKGPVDKACGEGLMPSGLAALERLGVLAHLDRTDSAPFDSIAWVQEDGRAVVGRLPAPGGLGVRRLALATAMVARAREAGVDLHEECPVTAHRIDATGVTLVTPRGDIRAKLLVGADGLQSKLRKEEGFAREWTGPRRFGLRRHVAQPPWGRSVEVHFAAGVEAYVTPAGSNRVGIAFLWEDGQIPSPVSFDALLARFPLLQRRIANAPWDSEPRGAGPLRQLVRARAGRRVVLVGDAAGYVDAITGEGLSLAFEGAAALGDILPDVLASGGSVASFAPYERRMRRAFQRYARLAGALVWTARRPALRRFVINRLVAAPGLFAWALGRATR